MTRQPVINEAEWIIRRAVELSRQPGDQSRTSGVGFNFETHEDAATATDEDGNTIHPFITNLDYTNDLNAVTIP